MPELLLSLEWPLEEAVRISIPRLRSPRPPIARLEIVRADQRTACPTASARFSTESSARFIFFGTAQIQTPSPASIASSIQNLS